VKNYRKMYSDEQNAIDDVTIAVIINGSGAQQSFSDMPREVVLGAVRFICRLVARQLLADE
jgi:hypothetical protein